MFHLSTLSKQALTKLQQSSLTLDSNRFTHNLSNYDQIEPSNHANYATLKHLKLK